MKPRVQMNKTDFFHVGGGTATSSPPPQRFWPRGGFLKITPTGIPTYADMKKNWFLGLMWSMETGFHAGIGRNADWNNL